MEAFEETLSWLSRLVEEILEISELDLNPIFAAPTSQDCRIVDARSRALHDPLFRITLLWSIRVL
ncbi:MAG: acetate--CoA ligase family protein [Nitrospira sp.]|nr:acetate--CoA ligase family protein [Nitrospira sp.]